MTSHSAPSDAALNAELKAAFGLFERQGTKGLVAVTDLKAIFHAVGVPISHDKIHRLLVKDGKETLTTLDFADVAGLARNLLRIRHLVDRDEDVFKCMDLDGTGRVTAAALQQAAAEHGAEALSDDEASAIVRAVAADPSGGIPLDAFLHAVRTRRAEAVELLDDVS